MKTPVSKDEKILYVLWSIALLAGIIFFIYYHISDVTLYTGDVSCGFKYYLHLYCPGCGGTRAVDSFLQGHFIQSFLYHPLIVYIAIYFMCYYIPATLRMFGVLGKKIDDMVYVYMLVGVLALLIINFILRNLLMVYCDIDYINECITYWQ